MAVGWMLFAQGQDLVFDFRVFLRLLRAVVQGLAGDTELAG